MPRTPLGGVQGAFYFLLPSYDFWCIHICPLSKPQQQIDPADWRVSYLHHCIPVRREAKPGPLFSAQFSLLKLQLKINLIFKVTNSFCCNSWKLITSSSPGALTQPPTLSYQSSACCYYPNRLQQRYIMLGIWGCCCCVRLQRTNLGWLNPLLTGRSCWTKPHLGGLDFLLASAQSQTQLNCLDKKKAV